MVVAFSAAQAGAWGAASIALLWMSVAITLYDQFFFARFDWSIITGERKRRAVHLAYFGAKIGWWFYAILIVMKIYTPGPIDCQGTMIAVETFMGITNTCSSILLACRAACVYRGQARTYVTYGLMLGGLGVAAAWFTGTEYIIASWSSVPSAAWQNGHCEMVEVKVEYFVKYLLTMLYDLVVLILTVVGVTRMTQAGSSRIGTVLIEQGCLYFLLVFFVNLPTLVLTAARTGPILSLFFAVPSSAISLVASTRLYAQLAEEAASKAGGVSHDHLTSSGSVSEKLINFFTRRNTVPRNGSAIGSSQGSEGTAKEYQSSSRQASLFESNGSTFDVEKQGSAVPAVLPSFRQSSSQPFGSLTEAAGGAKSPRQSRNEIRGQPQTTSFGSLTGVQVTQTQTTVEEPMPEYLAGELTKGQNQGEEASMLPESAAKHYPHLYSGWNAKR